MRALLYSVLSFLLILLLNGCFGSDRQNNESEATFEAPVIENLPESTLQDSVTITIRTRPHCEIYLEDDLVATTDSEGVALVVLRLEEEGSTKNFSLRVKDKEQYSETVSFSIYKLPAQSAASSSESSTTTSQQIETDLSSSASSTSSVSSQSSVSSSSQGVVITISSSSIPVNIVNSSSSGIFQQNSSSSISSTAAPDSTPVVSLALSADSLEVAEGNTTTLYVNATYQDGITKIITSGIQWSLSDDSKAKVQNNNLEALEEGAITLHATMQDIASSPLHLTIFKVINGHRLPPEPDETLNNSTLLGIDSNDNGVRDDVERWIYETYEEPVERGIMLQSAFAYQKVLVDPSRAQETMHYNRDSFSCEQYWLTHDQGLKNKYRYTEFDNNVKEFYFNTIARHIAYKKYLGHLSGGVYSLPKSSKEKCLFDEDGHLKEQP